MKLKKYSTDSGDVVSFAVLGLNRLQRIERILKSNSLISDLKRNGYFHLYNRSDDWFEFKYRDDTFFVNEPWGDSPDLIVWSESTTSEKISELAAIFEAERAGVIELIPFRPLQFFLFLSLSGLLLKWAMLAISEL